MLMFTLAISCLIISNLPWFMDLTFQAPMQYCSLQTTFTTGQIYSWALFLLWHRYFILSGAISNCSPLFSSSILDTFQPGGTHLPMSYVFAFLYCSWGSQGKNTEVVWHSLLQWTTFCQKYKLRTLIKLLIYLKKKWRKDWLLGSLDILSVFLWPEHIQQIGFFLFFSNQSKVTKISLKLKSVEMEIKSSITRVKCYKLVTSY